MQALGSWALVGRRRFPGWHGVHNVWFVHWCPIPIDSSPFPLFINTSSFSISCCPRKYCPAVGYHSCWRSSLQREDISCGSFLTSNCSWQVTYSATCAQYFLSMRGHTTLHPGTVVYFLHAQQGAVCLLIFRLEKSPNVGPKARDRPKGTWHLF